MPEPIWKPIASRDGYEQELDISHPRGAVRHRKIGSAEWVLGLAPDLSSSPDMARPKQQWRAPSINRERDREAARLKGILAQLEAIPAHRREDEHADVRAEIIRGQLRELRASGSSGTGSEDR